MVVSLRTLMVGSPQPRVTLLQWTNHDRALMVGSPAYRSAPALESEALLYAFVRYCNVLLSY